MGDVGRGEEEPDEANCIAQAAATVKHLVDVTDVYMHPRRPRALANLMTLVLDEGLRTLEWTRRL